jgi:hypothetical protein
VRATRLILLVAAAGLAAACSRASDESEAKRTPVPPPPPRVEIPSDLRIEVTVDGAPAEPITRARLEAVAPDFADTERRAWRVATLVPALARPGATVEAEGPRGIAIRAEHPDDPSMPQAVLFFTRRGDVVVAVLDPDDPFPRYHGHGGQLRRPGDTQPRLAPVRQLAIRTRP